MNQTAALDVVTHPSSPSRTARIMAFPLIRIVVAALVVAFPVVVTMDLAHAALDQSMRVAWPHLLASVLSLSAYRAYVRRVEKRAVVELGGAGAGREIGTGLLAGALLLTGTIGVLAALGSYGVSGHNGWTVLVAPVAELILVVLFEELLFRAVLFRILEQSLGSWIGLSVSGALFAAAHLSNTGVTLLSVGSTAMAGVLMAAAFMVTRRLWLPMGIHFAWNFLLDAVFSVPVSGHPSAGLLRSTLVGPEWLTGGAYGVEASVVAFAFVSAAATYFVALARRRGHIIPPPWRQKSAEEARRPMTATYRAVMLTGKGGAKALDVLQVAELPIPEPGPGQVRVRVRATGIGSTDFIVLGGSYRYGAPKIPFVPGYEIAGVVDALGHGVDGLRVGQRVAALTVYGGFGEMLVRGAEHFLPIPDGVSDRDAAAVILNYVTAYQAIHRVGRVQAGQTALVTGAAGGVGTAALQLLRLAGVKTYGAASSGKHATLRALGAVPIDYKAGKLDRLVHAFEPAGVDLVFDGIGGRSIGECIGALRPRGHLVAYGFMATTGALSTIAMFANILLGSRLRGRRGSFYGISALYQKDPTTFREDLPKVFALLAARKIDPMVAKTFPLLEARKALELLATGTVEGKIVVEDPS